LVQFERVPEKDVIIQLLSTTDPCFLLRLLIWQQVACTTFCPAETAFKTSNLIKKWHFNNRLAFDRTWRIGLKRDMQIVQNLT